MYEVERIRENIIRNTAENESSAEKALKCVLRRFLIRVWNYIPEHKKRLQGAFKGIYERD